MAAAIATLAFSSAGLAWSASGSWFIVPSPNPSGFENALSAVVRISASDAWAVGGLNHRGSHQTIGRSRPLVEHWDGSSWQVVETPRTPPSGAWLSGVAASSPSDVWAVGSMGGKGPDHDAVTLIEHYDGSRWSIVPSPSPGAVTYLRGVSASGPDDAWAVGSITDAQHGMEAPLAERWDGTSWTTVSLPSTGSDYTTINAIEQTSPADVWLVGTYLIPRAHRAFTEHWNGKKWKLIEIPAIGLDDELRGVSGSSPTDVWAVGATLSDQLRAIPMAEHWDGTSWNLVPVPYPPGGVFLGAVSAVSANEAWAVGEFGKRFANDVFEHWDGSAWSRVDAPFIKHHFSSLAAIAAGPDGAVAVGFQFEAKYGNETRTLTEACCS